MGFQHGNDADRLAEELRSLELSEILREAGDVADAAARGGDARAPGDRGASDEGSTHHSTMSKAFDALQPGRKSNPDASLNSRSTDNAVGKDSQDVDRDRDSGRGGPKHRRTLWMGGLEPNVTEAAIVAAFRSAGSHVPSRVQIMRSRHTRRPLPYAFLEFPTHEMAMEVLHTLSGKQIPGTNRFFRLNHAALAVGSDSTSHTSLYVSGLPPDMTDFTLEQHFRDILGEDVTSARVIIDHVTGSGKGYGFVRFRTIGSRNRALHQLVQHEIRPGFPVRVSLATEKRAMPEQQVPATQPAIEDSNATLFVDGIGAMPSEETWALFRTFGTVLSIKTPPGRSYGFVTYLHRASAEAAMVALSHERSGRGLRVTWSTRPKAEAPQGPDVGAAFPGQAALDPSSMATLSLLGLLPAGGGMAIPQVGMHGAQGHSLVSALQQQAAQAQIQEALYNQSMLYASSAPSMRPPAYYPQGMPLAASVGARQGGGGVPLMGGAHGSVDASHVPQLAAQLQAMQSRMLGSDYEGYRQVPQESNSFGRGHFQYNDYLGDGQQ